MGYLNVCVMGVGGVGGYFGGKLAHTFSSNSDSPAHIFFVARGKHLEAITRNGLVLKSPEFGKVTCRPTLATGKMSDLPPMDIFLICVKGYDLTDVTTLIKDYVKENTVILPLLNGADIQERIRNKIKTGIILPTCVYVSAHIEEPGVVAHIGKPGKMIFGRDPDHPDYIPHEIFRVFEKSSINYEWKDDANPAIWEKYIFIASFGLVSARYDRTLGEILEEPSLKEEVAGIMNEGLLHRFEEEYQTCLMELQIFLSRKRRCFPVTHKLRYRETSIRRKVRVSWSFSAARLSISEKNWEFLPQRRKRYIVN